MNNSLHLSVGTNSKRELRKRFTCIKCGKIFPSLKKLDEHSCTHSTDLGSKIQDSDGNVFTCEQCQRVFPSFSTLKKHLSLHIKDLNFGNETYKTIKRKSAGAGNDIKKKCFKCRDCAKRFCSLSKLHKHSTVHTPKLPQHPVRRKHDKGKPEKCPVCVKIFSHDYLPQHINSHFTEKCFKCKICEKIFPSLFRLNRHLSVHSSRKHSNWSKRVLLQNHFPKSSPTSLANVDDRVEISNSSFDFLKLPSSSASENGSTFNCGVCQKNFLTSKEFFTHLQLHSVERPYQCGTCEKAFGQKGGLIVHMRTHTGERPYKCNFCEKSFIDKSTLQTHVRTHTGERPFMCKICKKTFSGISSLRYHLKIHNNDKPFQCSMCKKGFIQKSDLSKHELVHTGKKLCKCNICDKSLSDASALKRHMVRHTGEKPYKCTMCDKVYTDHGSLLFHMKIHTLNNTYQCDLCQKIFMHQSELIKHLEHSDHAVKEKSEM